jgi:hypothetical protein
MAKENKENINRNNSIIEEELIIPQLFRHRDKK